MAIKLKNRESYTKIDLSKPTDLSESAEETNHTNEPQSNPSFIYKYFLPIGFITLVGSLLGGYYFLTHPINRNINSNSIRDDDDDGDDGGGGGDDNAGGGRRKGFIKPGPKDLIDRTDARDKDFVGKQIFFTTWSLHEIQKKKASLEAQNHNVTKIEIVIEPKLTPIIEVYGNYEEHTYELDKSISDIIDFEYYQNSNAF